MEPRQLAALMGAPAPRASICKSPPQAGRPVAAIWRCTADSGPVPDLSMSISSARQKSLLYARK
jgi:hypothetical protein